MSDFGPRITVKIVDSLREDINAGKLKSGSEIKVDYTGIYETLFMIYKNIIYSRSGYDCVSIE